MRWEAYMKELSKRGMQPSGLTVVIDADGEVTNVLTPAFPCGWDERDAKV